MNANWVIRLKEELLHPLPGTEAHLRLAPKVRRPVADDNPLKKSAVMILLYPYGDLIYTVFIKRTEYKGVHGGQISLPGGMFKKSDVSLSVTALRETMEETGILSEQANVIGQLTCLHIPVSNINVFPFVAVCDKRPEFIPDPIEVQYLIETNLDELLNPLNQKSGIMQVVGKEIEVPYYDISGNHIWGATAMIMSEFLEIFRRTM